jgi:creatinine amidohydrolase
MTMPSPSQHHARDHVVESRRELMARVGCIEELLSKALSREPAIGEQGSVHDAARDWLVTGAGGSEAPARLLVELLERAGRRARFVPLSLFALGGSSDADVLVVFSQGLSPNARLALSEQRRQRALVLFTAVVPRADAKPGSPARLCFELSHRGATIVLHDPASENGMLVRVIGPVLAAFAAAAFAAGCTGRRAGLAGAAECVRRARERARALMRGVPDGLRHADIALVVAGGDMPVAQGLRWKLLEGLGVADPPVWDVLQVAHGAFQQFYERPLLLLGVVTPDDRHNGERGGALTRSDLFDRLEAMLAPERQRLVRLTTSHPLPLAWFELDAQLNQLVIDLLAIRPRNLIDWPGKGRDAPLYRLGG